MNSISVVGSDIMADAGDLSQKMKLGERKGTKNKRKERGKEKTKEGVESGNLVRN